MLSEKEMSFSNVFFFGLASLICICGSRGAVVAISSLSVADSPHQQDEVASSPADITPPKTVLPPKSVPVPTGLSPVLAPSVSEAIPPAVHSSTAVQPPSPLSFQNRSPPVASPLHDQPISPVSHVQPTLPKAPPPQGGDFQASPPAPAVVTPPIVQPSLPKAPPPQGGDGQSSPPTPAIVSPPLVQPSLPRAPPPQRSDFQASPPTPAILSPPIVQPSLPKAPPPQGADSQASPPAPVIVPTPRVQPSLPTAPPPPQSDSQASPPAGNTSSTVSPPSDHSLPNSPPPQGSDFQASPPASNIPATVPPPTAQEAAPAKSPALQPSVGNPIPSRTPAPDQRNVVANPPRGQPNIVNAPPSRSSALAPGHAISPVSTKLDKNWTSPIAPTPKEGTGESISPAYSSPIKGSPLISPVPQQIPQIPYAKAPANTNATPPSVEMSHISPSASSKLRPHQQRSRKGAPSPATAPLNPPPTFPDPSPVSSPTSDERPRKSPIISPSISLPAKPTEAPAQSVMTLPPPPPNLDCNYLTCQDPLTDPIIGSPCTCVLPIKVGLCLSTPLYAFFTLVSDLAQQIGSGVKMSQQQVRVMGANAAEDQTDKTVVLVNLVPSQNRFDNATAFSTYEVFWKKQVPLKEKLFGDYEVLYVLYPGLPASPPSAAGNLNLDDSFTNGGNSRTMKPLGVDVGQRPIYRKNNASIIAVIVVSCIIALTIFTVVAWMLLLRRRDSSNSSPQRLLPRSFLSTFGGSSGTGHLLLPARHSSACSSFRSSMATYSGQAKNFRLAEIERATNYFDNSRILGEGGFGCVYRGILDDETHVAVKVLKRYDGQGEREFLSEVEMLGRLHHRNLVKLIGICVEENARCLVYELIPNGSVESHLHGLDTEACLLDWSTRMKIALGAARGLTYLHEDSSPCVIHRDFKSSNILLDHDFTPKVSDFGLARTALDEGNRHISTRVMGTFGYVAPEYAMTGHLLVKSDVYSYGVVLLELLTGRKPVDMSRPSGQENLVTWARPLLTSVDGLKQIIDPALGSEVPFDRVAKAAAIASMCVQPEVAHRPSMSEVVQALKLVCNLSDEYKDYGTCSQELMVHAARILGNGSGIEAERVLLSEMFASPPMYNIYNGDVEGGHGSGSFRRYNSSGPLVTGKSRKFWQRLRSNTGSMSDHGTSFGFDTRSEGSDQ